MSTSAGCGAARRCRGTRTFAGPVALLLALLASLSFGARANAAPEAEGIHKIQHVVMIMQENRSFDSYFGTYPGANGIPSGVCVPDPINGGCDRPFHDPADKNSGGPHGTEAQAADINDGRMDGFVEQAQSRGKSEMHGHEPRMQRVQRRTGRRRRNPAAGQLHRRDGLPRRARDPQLLDLRAELRAPGQHVRVGRLVEPARAPVPRLRLVGGMPEGRSQPGRLRKLARPATPRQDVERAARARQSDVRVDRHHLPAREGPRQLALLRLRRKRARLRVR